jgi:hypothetical protein
MRKKKIIRVLKKRAEKKQTVSAEAGGESFHVLFGQPVLSWIYE